MDRYLTIVQVAESLGVAARTVRGWKSKGKIPVTILPGGDVRFNEKEIVHWLESRTIRKKNPYDNKTTTGGAQLDGAGFNTEKKIKA